MFCEVFISNIFWLHITMSSGQQTLNLYGLLDFFEKLKIPFNKETDFYLQWSSSGCNVDTVNLMLSILKVKKVSYILFTEQYVPMNEISQQ